MCSFLLFFLILVIAFSHLHDSAQTKFKHLEAERQTPKGGSTQTVAFTQERGNLFVSDITGSGQKHFPQTSFSGFCIHQQDHDSNQFQNGYGGGLSVDLPVRAPKQKVGEPLSHGTQGTQGVKHDVTPKQKTYGGGAQWSESWEDWENSWEKWTDSPNWEDWDGAESTGRASSHSPRARQPQQMAYSPRSRQAKGKGKGKWKGKGKTKGELAFRPFGSGKGAMPSLPPWPAWESPEIGASPFQTAQSGKGSTMQEMAVHLRQAYEEKETPSDVQAFLDKAEKEYSRNNIKSLHAATKSLDHAQKALREVATASWCGGYSCVW